MNLKGKNILIIGDDKVAANITFAPLDVSQKPATVNIITEPFANFKESVRLGDIHLENYPNIDLFMIFPFLWELVYIKRGQIKKRSKLETLHIKEYIDYSLQGLLEEVKLATTKWCMKYPHLKVCWCLPYIPDFARYNEASKFSKKGFTEEEREAKELYSRIKKFVEVWTIEIPDILVLDLNECYFLGENYMEISFQETSFSQVHFPTSCTFDGLVPNNQFNFKFVKVFEKKVYPYLNNGASKDVSIPITSQEGTSSLSSYSNRDTHCYPEKHKSEQSLVFDYQHSRQTMYNNSPQPQTISPAIHKSAYSDYYSVDYEHKTPPNYSRNYTEPVTSSKLDYQNSRQQQYDDSHIQDHNERTVSYNSEGHLGQMQNNSADLGPGLFEFLSSANLGNEEKPALPDLNLTDIPDGLLNNIKNALKFITTAQNNKKVNEIERKPSPYAKFLHTLFNPKEWTDLFLNGDLNIAVDCLYTCYELMSKFDSKKGLKVIMVTSSQELVTAAEKSLNNLVEQNKIGINDNIPFGAPVFLVDLPCNLRMRLSQPKFQNLSQLVALFVFGDSLLTNRTSSNIEFSHLMKGILSKANTENLCKIVISESGSTEAEVVAQTALKTTFFTPKKATQPDKGNEGNEIAKQGLSDFLSQTLKEECKASTASYPKRPSKEKSSSPSRKKRKSSHGYSAGAADDVVKSPSPSAKLESIFKLANIPIPEKELKDYEEHDKTFMSFLYTLGSAAEKEYMILGRDALTSHEADYKSYKEIPDLHPAFEEKYEIFVKQFEEVYGKDHNPQHLQKTWKHFWDMIINSLQEKEWKEKKKKLQQDFKEKYASKAAEIAEEKKKANDQRKSRKGSHVKKSGHTNDSREKKDTNLKTSLPSGKVVKSQRIEKEKTEQPKKTEHKEKEQKTTEKKSTKDKKEEHSGTLKTFPVVKGGSERQDKAVKDFDSQTLSVDDDFKRIYLESCSKLSQKTGSKVKLPISVSDHPIPTQAKQINPNSMRLKDDSKPKIVFNLGRPKSKEEKQPKFSLEVALHYLETISDKIGMMGPAVLAIVQTAKEQLKISEYNAFKVFTDKESELLVNIAINKLKTLMTSCPWSEAEMYRSALPLFHKLLNEAKEVTKKSVVEEKKPSSQHNRQIDLQAIAKATMGFDAELTFSFIKNTFLYKGLSEPSKEELKKIFTDVSAIHFQMAMF